MWLQYYERQTMVAVMRGLESAFRSFGGVPSELLFDQMKAVVLGDRRDEGGRLAENPEFLRFSMHWASASGRAARTGPRPRARWNAWSATLRKNFFYGRSFASDDDLNAQVVQWLDTVANVRIHGTLKERPARRFEAERPHLMPLAPWTYRPVAPRPVEAAPGRAAEAVVLPLVDVEYRPLAEYARIAGGGS